MRRDRRHRGTAWGAGMAALVLAACSNPSEGEETATRGRSTEAATVTIVSLTPAEVHRLVVAPAGAPAAGLVRAAGGRWLPEAGTPPGSPALMATTEDGLLPLLAYRRLDAEAGRDGFGLAAPELTVRVEDAAGRPVTISVGGPTFSGGGFYAAVTGETIPRDDRTVYLLARRTVDDLRSLARGERVDTPRSAEETEAIEGIDRTDDPETVDNPFLAQVIAEVPE